jgi:hypothetical protein
VLLTALDDLESIVITTVVADRRVAKTVLMVMAAEVMTSAGWRHGSRVRPLVLMLPDLVTGTDGVSRIIDRLGILAPCAGCWFSCGCPGARAGATNISSGRL